LKRVLLIDADIVAYEAASSVEVATHWGDGYWTWHCDENEVRNTVASQIDRAMTTLKGDEYKLCLTDSAGNFRKKLSPTYKGNRASVKKPLVLKAIRQWMIDEHGAFLRPGLEGDDCMGILATWSGLQGEKVIVSIDKDMKTIPGLFCQDLSKGIIEVPQTEADYWHMFQTLTGDSTDGYPGCPGIGPKKAEAILMGSMPPWGTPQEGWAAVVKTFTKAGLNESEAILQARLARILTADLYDFKNKAPILWVPPAI
jgi:DNA polymerase-1